MGFVLSFTPAFICHRGAHEYGNLLLFATLLEKEGLAEREREIENKEGEKCLQWS